MGGWGGRLCFPFLAGLPSPRGVSTQLLAWFSGQGFQSPCPMEAFRVVLCFPEMLLHASRVCRACVQHGVCPAWPRGHCDFCVCVHTACACQLCLAGSCCECVCVHVRSVCVMCPRGDFCVLGLGRPPGHLVDSLSVRDETEVAGARWLPDSVPFPQAEVCSGTVADVLQSVVSGADGCIFSFGHVSLGKCPLPSPLCSRWAPFLGGVGGGHIPYGQ